MQIGIAYVGGPTTAGGDTYRVRWIKFGI